MKKKKRVIDEKGSGVLTLLFLLVLVFFLMILVYLFYLNLSNETEKGEIVEMNIPKNVSVISEVKQFFPNTKFNHNSISFKIDSNCDLKKQNRMARAFEFVEKEVVGLNFYEVTDGEDISVTCSEWGEEVPGNYFIAGEGGAKEIIQTGEYNVITEGIILLYDNENSKTFKCIYPGVELHELMHVFGFDHVEDKNSIMYPYLESCEQRLDKSIIDELKRLYSLKNLPDLYFEKVDIIKHNCGFGSCIDFNLTIKNLGVVKAENVKFSILEDGKSLETRELKENIDFGAGIIIGIENLKLKKRDVKEITFIIDESNTIEEIDEWNNRAVVKF